jgi:hypothetical protein
VQADESRQRRTGKARVRWKAERTMEFSRIIVAARFECFQSRFGFSLLIHLSVAIKILLFLNNFRSHRRSRQQINKIILPFPIMIVLRCERTDERLKRVIL